MVTNAVSTLTSGMGMRHYQNSDYQWDPRGGYACMRIAMIAHDACKI